MMEYQIGQRVEVFDTAIRKARWRKGTIISKCDSPAEHYEVKIDRGLFGVFRKEDIRHDSGHVFHNAPSQITGRVIAPPPTAVALYVGLLASDTTRCVPFSPATQVGRDATVTGVER